MSHLNQPPPFAGGDTSALLTELNDWLIEQALHGCEVSLLLQGFCERLCRMGLNLGRGHVAATTVDTLTQAFSSSWTPSGEVRTETFAHRETPNEAWLQSPLYYMLIHNLPEVYFRLDSRTDPDFPLFDELAGAGLVDYYGTQFSFGWSADDIYRTAVAATELGMICSWASTRGFSSDQRALLRKLLPTFAVAVKAAVIPQVAHNICAAYLGPDVARRVLKGEVRRGFGHYVQAAILFADLSGFTRLADQVSAAEMVGMLNQYFEQMVQPVEEQGGQVLKFMGDGLLATFEMQSSVAAAGAAASCEAALAAALAMLARIQTFNRDRERAGQETMAVDIAVHIGEVMYGNVGSSTRLDFTVIGPVVNEAARMEALCAELGVHLLFSQAVYEQLDNSDWPLIALGKHRLRGVRQPRTLYTLAWDGLTS